MKVYNDDNNKNLNDEIIKTLAFLRDKKNFDPKKYINAKLYILNEYLINHKIESCVVAVSGGIDSAVVLGLLNELRKIYPNTIKSIIPVCMPAMNSNGGVVNQESATYRGEILINKLGLKPYIVDLSSGFLSLKSEIDAKVEIKGKEWANGQFIPYLRTASLYYITALSNQQDSRSILVGTTNRDEGLYLGYFGKASDGMVDVQLISDLHKSEVYSLARYLNLPKEVIDVIPTGDMYDYRSDEEVFGASYDFVELFLHFKSLPKSVINVITREWQKNDYKQYEYLSKKLENMHNYNKHKYIGCSPAVHLDIDYMIIDDCWKNNVTINYNVKDFNIDLNRINGFCDYKVNFSLFENKVSFKSKNDKFVQLNIFNKKECEVLDSEIKMYTPSEAEFTGYKKTKGDVGSYRRSFFDKDFAELIKIKIEKYVDKYLIENNDIFYFYGISDLFRSIEYKSNGGLYPHYDHSFKYNDNKVTKKSLVIYLNEVNELSGGRTRFIKNQECNKKDWNRFPENSEIDCLVECEIGDCIIFDHDVLHDSEIIKQNKHIIRTDIIYIKNKV